MLFKTSVLCGGGGRESRLLAELTPGWSSLLCLFLSPSKVHCFPGRKMYFHSSPALHQSGGRLEMNLPKPGVAITRTATKSSYTESPRQTSLPLQFLECEERSNTQTKKRKKLRHLNGEPVRAAGHCPSSMWGGAGISARLSQPLHLLPSLKGAAKCRPACLLGFPHLEMHFGNGLESHQVPHLLFFSVINFIEFPSKMNSQGHLFQIKTAAPPKKKGS